MTEGPPPSGDPAGHLVLTEDFKPMVGGIAQYLHGLARALSEHGRVEVMAYGIDPSEAFTPGYEVTYVPGVERHVGDRPGDGFAAIRKLNTALYYRELRADATRAFDRFVELDPGRSDRIYVGVWSRAAHWWCRRLREMGRPYRLFTYGFEFRRALGPVWSRRRARDVRSARVVYACSEATASLVRGRHGGLDVRAVPPGISEPDGLDRIREAAEGLRRRLAIEEDARILLTVARLVRRKGVHRVLETLASREFADRNVRYLVVGSGPERGPLEGLREKLGLEGRVDFLGRVDERTKWAAYMVADLFLMPHDDLQGRDWEGFGIVFLEAAIMSLPAVAGKSGGAGEAVRDGVTGLLVDPDGDGDLRDALLRLLRNGSLRREMGRRARRRALEEFSWEEAAKKVLEVG